jgi:hypothetical protein
MVYDSALTMEAGSVCKTVGERTAIHPTRRTPHSCRVLRASRPTNPAATCGSVCGLLARSVLPEIESRSSASGPCTVFWEDYELLDARHFTPSDLITVPSILHLFSEQDMRLCCTQPRPFLTTGLSSISKYTRHAYKYQNKLRGL